MYQIHAGAQPILRLGRRQFRTLEFALLYQGWHTFNTRDRAACRAIASLAKRRVLEVNGDQFRWNDQRGQVP